MIGFLIQRVLQALMVVIAMSIIVFLGVYAIGNPIDVMIDPASDQALREALIHRYGLDRSLIEQYFVFMNNMLHGDLGESFIYRLPVLSLIWSRFPATLELALTAMMIATCLGIPLGLWAGYKPESLSAKTIMGLSVLGFSVPSFWVGLLLIMTFAVELGWLPSGGRGPTTQVLGMNLSITSLEGWSYIILPAFNLALFKLGLLIRLTRAGTVEVMSSDYVRFARAQGLSEGKVVGLHVLKNISIPHRYRLRPRARLNARLRSGDGNRLQLAGHGQAHHRFHHGARSPGDGRLSDPRGVPLRSDQSRRRSGLWPARPAHSRKGCVMSSSSALPLPPRPAGPGSPISGRTIGRARSPWLP